MDGTKIGKLRFDDGSSFDITARTLCIFLDETGDEGFSNPEYPMFGLGGCAMPGQEYVQTIRPAWEAMRQKHFRNRRKALHAKDMGRASAAAKSAVERFMRSQPFGRVSAFETRATKLDAPLTAYETTAAALMGRIRVVAGAFGFDNVVMLLEESARTEQLSSAVFSQWGLALQEGEKTTPIPISHFFSPKELREPGMEIADFLLHSAGTHVRNSRFGQNKAPVISFEAAFKGAVYSSYLLVDEVKFAPSCSA